MKTLVSQIMALREKALAKLSKANEVFCNNFESDLFYELPIHFQVTKHGYYEEYAIVSIEGRQARCIAKGESDEPEITIDLEDIETVNLCHLADLL